MAADERPSTSRRWRTRERRIVLGRYAGSDAALVGVLGDLRTISSGTLLCPSDTRALLEGAGLVDVREIERTWPTPIGLTAGRRP